MKRLIIGVAMFGAMSAAALVARPASAVDAAAFDAKIVNELRAKNPEAAAIFEQANAARDRGDFDAAFELYSKTRALSPDFVHATRRACSAELARGHRSEAIALCRNALAADDSPENRSALARALATGSPSSIDAREALANAENAATRAPDDASAQQSLCAAAMAANDLGALKRCSKSLDALAPNDVVTDMFAAIALASENDADAARARLDRARAHGLDAKVYDDFARSLDENRPWYAGIVRYGPRIAVGWLAGFALLLLAGLALSRAAMVTASRLPTGDGGHARGLDLALRRVYRAVLWGSCAYYYASLPLLAAAMVLLGGGAVVAMFAVGHIPVKLVLIIGVVVLWTLWAIAKSVFVRGRDVDPGERLDPTSEPLLDAVLADVAARIGTRKVDAVYMTPGTDIAVLERGGLLKQLRGRPERALVLGAAVLEGMRVRQLKAILAHEYGHFHNEDTAGGGFALAVRRSVLTMAISLIRSGVATVYNPAWWFVRGFHAVFLRISQGASRLQEVLADRWAVSAYGSEAFATGLRHVIARSVAFDAHADATLNEVIAEKRALANLYAYAPSAALDAAAIESKIEAAVTHPSSPYDSHPKPADRIAAAERAAISGAPASADDALDAWSLFADRDAVERRMTRAVREQLFAAQRVVIPEAA